MNLYWGLRPGMSYGRFLALVAAMVVGLAGSVHGEDWPEFRGPTGDGVYPGKLPLRWSETNTTREGILWKTPIHDKGWSSPIVVGSKVWLTTASEDGTALFAVAVNRQSGQVVHDLELFRPKNPPNIKQYNSHASPTPAAAEGKIVAHFGSYGTACLDADTGAVLWRVTDLPCNHFRGPASSPLIHQGVVYLHFDGYDLQYIAALDAKTGKLLWRKDRDLPYPEDGDFKKAFSTPAIISVNGQDQLISSAATGTIAYDPKTGSELWRVITGGMNQASRPIYRHGLIYLTAGHTQSLWAIQPASGERSSPNVVWQSKKEAPSKSSPLLDQDWLFMVNDKGILSCLDAKSGKLLKQERLPAPFAASPLLADGKIYLVSEGATAKTFIVQANPTLELLQTNTLPEGAYASPAAADGVLYIRTKQHLYALGSR